MEEEKVMRDEAAGSGQLHIRLLTELRPVVTFRRRCLACIECFAPVVNDQWFILTFFGGLEG